MKREIFSWLFLIFFCNALSHYACQSASTPKPKHNPLMTRPKQLEKEYESVAGSKRKGYPKRTQEQMHEVDLKSFQRVTKGVYGGGDTLRPRSTPKKNESTSLLLKSSNLLSAMLINAILGFTIFVVFF